MYSYQTNIFLHQTSLKKHLRRVFDLNWTGYLILVAVNKIEEIDGRVATKDVIAELQLGRAWTYNAVSSLVQKGYLEIAKTKNPWRSNRLSTSVGGRIILTGAERHISERTRVKDSSLV